MKKIHKIKSIMKALFLWFSEKIVLRKPLSVLMYHSVSDNDYFFIVNPKDFLWQMEYLYKNKYNVVSFSEIELNIKNKKEIPPKTIVITFDDGYEDNYQIVWPIIKKYNFPITIFLTTSLVGGKRELREGKSLPILNEEQIKEMSQDSLVTFAPHGHTHKKLNKIESQLEMEKEILDSKKYVEGVTGKPSKIYAYAYGKYNDKVLGIIKNIFSYGFSVQSGFCDLFDLAKNPLTIPRQSIDSSVSHCHFKLKI